MDVKTWLESNALGKYVDAFLANAIDLDIVASLSEADLVELGLSLGDRKRAMRAIQELPKYGAVAEWPDLQQTGHLAHHAIPERRHLSVIFVDLIGSTQLSNQMNLEDYRGTLHRYQNLCLDVIRAHNGHVAQFLGDGVVGYFGYPRVEENDAERAVTAGLELCEAMGKLRRTDGRPLAVRVGISSGEAVVDEHSTFGGLVFGNVPNLAARIQAHADPSSVVISDRTKDLIGKNFVCDWKGKHALKGFDDPVGVWQLVRAEKSTLRFRNRPRAREDTFVDREDERRVLEDCWRLTRGGKGQTVMISGQAGIGKSCLIEVVSQSIASGGRMQLDFQCAPNHEASAYFPIKTCIETLAGIRISDDNAQKLKKLEKLLDDNDGKTDSTLALFASLISVSLPGQQEAPDLASSQSSDQIQAALVKIVGSMAARQPVLMLFEDLQWVDPSTEQLIDLLSKQLRSVPVMIVCTYRPGYHPPWAGRDGVNTIELRRLGQGDVLEMLNNLLKTIPVSPDVKQRIATRTGGVPLFTEEMARMVEDRFSDTDPKRSEDEALFLPSTLKELFWSMIDRLNEARALVPICAAIGQNIRPAMVKMVSESTDAETQSALNELVEAQILVPRGDDADRLYAFRHGLIQEAAYELMLPSRARAVHKRIAAVMREDFKTLSDQHPELLAYHFSRAEMFSQARDAWCQAAAVAASRSANEETIRHLRSALSENEKTEASATRDREEIAVRKMLNLALSKRAFGSAEVMENFRRYRDLLERTSGDGADTFLAVHVQFGAQLMQSDAPGALVLCDYLQEIADRTGDPTMQALTAHNLGMSNFMLGRLDAAISAFDQALYLRKQTSRADVLTYHESDIQLVDAVMRCWAHALKPDNQATAQQLISEAQELVRADQHDFTRCYALNVLATAYQNLGDVPRLRRLVDEAMEISGKREFRYWYAWGEILLGWAHTTQGEYERGIEELRKGIQDYQATGSTQILLYARTLLADAYLEAARYEEGLEEIQRIREDEKRLTVRYQMPLTDRVENTLRLTLGATVL
ncbi:AAA family ATPase [Ruegeria sp. HKCCD7255]|uniref:AAA family ATPase n=1 Tax=Ruegeria sp. HKCCD7255 TaxID=2683004 RepID=UPI0014897180|nr:adenylate/guanylate cyclase domain-containing protein [Ruegeria sp. HKCCD7255]